MSKHKTEKYVNHVMFMIVLVGFINTLHSFHLQTTLRQCLGCLKVVKQLRKRSLKKSKLC